MWWKRTVKVDESLPDERIKLLERKIMKLEAEQLDIITSLAVIRDKVLRKIQFKRLKTEEEEEEESKKDPYNGVLVPYDGYFKHNR